MIQLLGKCSICKNKFKQFSSTQKCCSWQCALKQAEKDRKKQAHKEKRLKLDSIKSLSEHLGEAQKEFNAFIRDRDKNLPCISCGRFHNGQWHAGHYRSIGAASHLRFDEDNVHKQCSVCNNHKSGNAIEYRINLVRKIGLTRVEALESNNEIKKYTVEDAKRIKKEYREKRRSLQGVQ